ncbi:MAG TPA: glycosyltransferase family 39 protein [Candidatus Saccharimonadales bacterium]|nr:glycosyltransferase family 39 protein [Candidatus Saccharimonadales bacterium]
MKYKLFFLSLIFLLGFFLRFIDVSNDPPGLYIDEASIGYNAYSVLTTGKDEYGIVHPLWFKSFGDYKMPTYIYSVAGAMTVFGENEFAVRIPSVIAGTLTIFVLYLFLEKLLELEKDKNLQKKLRYLPLLASFFLAISTWHLQFSRGGFEVNLATFFYLVGCYFFVAFKKNRKTLPILLSLFFFVLTMYTYDVFRVIAPLTLLSIAFIEKWYKNKNSLYLIVWIAVLSLPVIIFSITTEGAQRFSDTSAFSQLKFTFLYQKILVYPLLYISNYLSFFSLDYFFSFGDGIGRHQVQNFGELYRWQLPFFLSGIYFLLKTPKSVLKYATFLLFLSVPLAGAVAQPSPHALRALPMVIPCMIFVALGFIFLLDKIKQYKFKVLMIALVALFALFEFAYYLQFYFVNYPQDNLPDWGAGYKQLVLATSKVKNQYKHIVIDTTLSYAPVYFHFYDNSISFQMVSPNWNEPTSWKKDKVLYIRPYFGYKNETDIIASIYTQKVNPDVFAQLHELK